MINYNVDSDGIATITWDMPNRSMNVLNEASMTAYAGALETAMKDAKVKGIIITSAKDSFIAGADVKMLESVATAEAARAIVQRGHDAMAKLAACCRAAAARSASRA